MIEPLFVARNIDYSNIIAPCCNDRSAEDKLKALAEVIGRFIRTTSSPTHEASAQEPPLPKIASEWPLYQGHIFYLPEKMLRRVPRSQKHPKLEKIDHIFFEELSHN